MENNLKESKSFTCKGWKISPRRWWIFNMTHGATALELTEIPMKHTYIEVRW